MMQLQRIVKTRRRHRVSVLLMASVIAVVVITTLAPWIRFKIMEVASIQSDSPLCQILADTLKNNTKGIDYAVEDVGLYGGDTRGWSTYILVESDLNSYVENKLANVANDNNAPVGVRIQATWIMWRRTADVVYLERIFRLVSEPGSAEVFVGRQRIASALTDLDVASKIIVPGNEPVAITWKEIRHAMGKE